jgi:predicted NBD/HSP70 family sugar kinase
VNAIDSPRPLQSTSGAGHLLQLMRDGQPRTRAELSQLTGLARSAVGARVDALLAAGLLSPYGDAVSTGGRPPARFAFNPTARVLLAADLGATHGTVALTDLGGSVIVERKDRIEIAKGPEPVLAWLVATGHELLAEAGRSKSDLVGVGVGLPGPVEHSTGKPVNPPIMPNWHGYDVPARIAAELGGPVLVDNDVNIMALGEHETAFSDVEHLLFVKVATGIGAGIISGGRLHRGAQGAAGDLGHVQAPHGGDAPCSCGNHGCLEAIASGSAIAARLRAEGIDVKGSREVVDLVLAGSIPAANAVRQAGRDIGEVLATVVSLLNPSVIVIGGVVSEAAEGLLAGIREVVYGRSLPLSTGELRIVGSRTGEQAGVIGAAVMVIQHVLFPEQIDTELRTEKAGLAG